MKQAEIGHLLGSVVEPVPEYDRGHRVDVEFGDSFAESGGFEISTLHHNHFLLCEKLKNFADLSLDHSWPVLVGVEGSPEEFVQAFFGLRVTCRDGRENMRSQDLLNSEFRPEFLGLGDDVVLHEPVSLILVSSNQDRLTVLVVLWTTGSSAELFVLENANRVSSVSGFETLVAAYDDCSSRKVYACCERRGCGENLDPPVSESGLRNSTVGSRESRVVKSCTGGYLAGEGLAEACLLSRGQDSFCYGVE